ncbi:hypothetical protein HDV00_011922 [Rhizophlyctis rosea]|nr:hypothetical protein HDV00_011922 [Rhizophlyctis rosea]
MQVIRDEEMSDYKKKMKEFGLVNWQYKRTLPALYGYIYNNHFSVITDPDFKKSLVERSKAEVVESSVSRKQQKKKKGTEVDDFEHPEVIVQTIDNILEIENKRDKFSDDTIYYVEGSDTHVLHRILREYIKKTKFIPEVGAGTSFKDSLSCIKSLVLKFGNKIVMEDNLEQRCIGAEKLGIPFKNQTRSSITMEKFSEMYPNMRKSTLTNQMKRILDNEGKPAIFVGKLQEWPRDATTLAAIDYPKFYRTACYEMSLPFPVFTIFDEVEGYDSDKCNGGEKAGWYFVKTDCQIPTNGDGWYSNVVVQTLKKKNIPHVVTHMLLSTYSLPGDYFRRFIKELILAFGSNGAKAYFNDFVGNCGRKERSTKHKVNFAQTKDEASTYFLKFEPDGWNAAMVRLFDTEHDGFDLFHISAAQFVQTAESNRPIRKQIIDYANCLLHDMICNTVGFVEQVLAVKTDCIVVRKKNVLLGHIGKDYRVEKRLPIVEKMLSPPRLCGTPTPSSGWTRKIKLTVKSGENGGKMSLEILGTQGCMQGCGHRTRLVVRTCHVIG